MIGRETLILTGRIEEMAQACIDTPGLVTQPAFDEFVEELKSVSDDLAGAFVRTVYEGLAAMREAS